MFHDLFTELALADRRLSGGIQHARSFDTHPSRTELLGGDLIKAEGETPVKHVADGFSRGVASYDVRVSIRENVAGVTQI